MKLLLLLLLAVTMPAFCFAQNSTITGNVIVNFNYTQNGPDAASEVDLFNVNKKYSLNILDRDSVKKTTTNIDGNYVFKNVEPGEYIIYIKSKGALVAPFLLFNYLKGPLSKKLKSISGFDFSTHNQPLQAEIHVLLDQSYKLSTDKKFNKSIKVTNEMNKKIKEYLESLPDEIKLFFGLFGGGEMAREFKEITVKPGINENYTTIFKVLF